ncbi:hypothetical protein E4U34_000497 [Claviceps purpurea]|nr:hypothetical protein E4U34_000497 [Claviceps purpurea]
MASDASDTDYSSEIDYLPDDYVPDADYPPDADDSSDADASSDVNASSEAELTAVQRWIDPATGLPSFYRRTQHNLEERTVAAVELYREGFYPSITKAAAAELRRIQEKSLKRQERDERTLVVAKWGPITVLDARARAAKDENNRREAQEEENCRIRKKEVRIEVGFLRCWLSDGPRPRSVRRRLLYLRPIQPSSLN